MANGPKVGLITLLQICRSLSAEPRRTLGVAWGEPQASSLGLGFRFPASSLVGFRR